MAYMTNREFYEHQHKQNKRNEYADALVKEVRRLREELTASQRREKAAVELINEVANMPLGLECDDEYYLYGEIFTAVSKCQKWLDPQEAGKGDAE